VLAAVGVAAEATVIGAARLTVMMNVATIDIARNRT
jgi:hypothetical protein